MQLCVVNAGGVYGPTSAGIALVWRIRWPIVVTEVPPPPPAQSNLCRGTLTLVCGSVESDYATHESNTCTAVPPQDLQIIIIVVHSLESRARQPPLHN